MNWSCAGLQKDDILQHLSSAANCEGIDICELSR